MFVFLLTVNPFRRPGKHVSLWIPFNFLCVRGGISKMKCQLDTWWIGCVQASSSAVHITDEWRNSSENLTATFIQNSKLIANYNRKRNFPEKLKRNKDRFTSHGNLRDKYQYMHWLGRTDNVSWGQCLVFPCQAKKCCRTDSLKCIQRTREQWVAS